VKLVSVCEGERANKQEKAKEKREEEKERVGDRQRRERGARGGSIHPQTCT
jgi:hypothetical protein